MERLGYGGPQDYDDDDHGHGDGDHSQDYQGQAYQPVFDLDPDHDDFDDAYLADHLQDAVADSVDYEAAADAVNDTTRKIRARLRWREGARLSWEGEEWTPPDTRHFRAPVFIRPSDLTPPEVYVPLYYDDPDDESL